MINFAPKEQPLQAKLGLEGEALRHPLKAIPKITNQQRVRK